MLGGNSFGGGGGGGMGGDGGFSGGMLGGDSFGGGGFGAPNPATASYSNGSGMLGGDGGFSGGMLGGDSFGGGGFGGVTAPSTRSVTPATDPFGSSGMLGGDSFGGSGFGGGGGGSTNNGMLGGDGDFSGGMLSGDSFGGGGFGGGGGGGGNNGMLGGGDGGFSGGMLGGDSFGGGGFSNVGFRSQSSSSPAVPAPTKKGYEAPVSERALPFTPEDASNLMNLLRERAPLPHLTREEQERLCAFAHTLSELNENARALDEFGRRYMVDVGLYHASTAKKEKPAVVLESLSRNLPKEIKGTAFTPPSSQPLLRRRYPSLHACIWSNFGLLPTL
jgi:hypothetical protein